MAEGTILRSIAVYTLGRHFTPDITIVEGHRIVTEGVYRFLRHPSYTGELFIFRGLALVFWHFPSSLFVFLLPLFGFLYRTFLEERKLLEVFGDEYRKYIQSTRRFLQEIRTLPPGFLEKNHGERGSICGTSSALPALSFFSSSWEPSPGMPLSQEIPYQPSP